MIFFENKGGKIMKITKDNYLRTSDGAWIYFEDYAGSGDPIILLHGFMLSTKLFKKNIEGISKSNRLILVDWRGHGNSSKIPSNLNMERCAQDIKELIEFLNLDSVTLLAHSMGGSVVMQYYKSYKNYKLKKIGFLDSYMYPFSYEDWNTHALKGFNIDGMLNNIDKLTLKREDYCYNFAKSLFPSEKNTSEEDIDFVKEQAKKTPSWIAFPLYNDFLFQDYLDTIAEVNIPFFICGAESPIVRDGINIAHHYAELAQNSYVAEFEGDGHIMFYTNPEKFNEKILDFANNYDLGNSDSTLKGTNVLETD